MGTKKISQLEETNIFNDNDLIPIVDVENEITKKTKIRNFGLFPKEWKQATINNEYLSGGSCIYTKVGKIVFGIIEDMIVSKEINNTAGTAKLFTGLPTTNRDIVFMIGQYYTSKLGRVRVNGTEGNIVAWYNSFSVSNNQWYGSFIYITNE